MSDGAYLGVSAQRALETVIGGKDQPTKQERMTAGEMADWVMAATLADATDYEGTARYAAKLIVEWLGSDPRRAGLPVENVYEKGADGAMNYAAPAQLGWYDLMKADGIPIDDLGLSGFMWGWAANAARRCVELPPVPNPAILTIGES